MSEMSNIPYCGPPVAPSELWSRWNLDPVLIACLIAIGIGLCRRRQRGPAQRGGLPLGARTRLFLRGLGRCVRRAHFAALRVVRIAVFSPRRPTHDPHHDRGAPYCAGPAWKCVRRLAARRDLTSLPPRALTERGGRPAFLASCFGCGTRPPLIRRRFQARSFTGQCTSAYSAQRFGCGAR